jgi:uncharacterized protein (DUF433 family)
MSLLRYTNSVPMTTTTTLDLNWTGRPRSIASVPLESDGHRALRRALAAAGRTPKPGRLMVFSQGSGTSQEMNMAQLDRIIQDPGVMGGKPCIRGMRVTVGMIVGQIGAGHSIEEVLADYPYLEREDVLQALRYAAWLAEEREVTLPSA